MLIKMVIVVLFHFKILDNKHTLVIGIVIKLVTHLKVITKHYGIGLISR